MDFLSILLSGLGIGSDRANRIADLRIEAARLNAEVAGDVGRALDLLAFATPRLLQRCRDLCPDQPEIAAICARTLEEQRLAASQLMALTRTNKDGIASANSLKDWDSLVANLHEWRATASRICPWIEQIIMRYDSVLDQEALRLNVQP